MRVMRRPWRMVVLAGAMVLAIFGLVRGEASSRGPRFLYREHFRSGWSASVLQVDTFALPSIRRDVAVTSYAPITSAATAPQSRSKTVKLRIGRLLVNVQGPWRASR
jgi:hypothetical protein